MGFALSLVALSQFAALGGGELSGSRRRDLLLCGWLAVGVASLRLIGYCWEGADPLYSLPCDFIFFVCFCSWFWSVD